MSTLIYFLSKKDKAPDNNKQQTASEKVLAINKTLKQACTQNNPTMAKDVLLQWGREKFILSNLATIAQQCDVNLQDEILSLFCIVIIQKHGKAMLCGRLFKIINLLI